MEITMLTDIVAHDASSSSCVKPSNLRNITNKMLLSPTDEAGP